MAKGDTGGGASAGGSMNFRGAPVKPTNYSTGMQSIAPSSGVMANPIAPPVNSGTPSYGWGGQQYLQPSGGMNQNRNFGNRFLANTGGRSGFEQQTGGQNVNQSGNPNAGQNPWQQAQLMPGSNPWMAW